MKRYQAVSIKIEGSSGKKSKCYRVTVHDRYGRDGIFDVFYNSKSKKNVIKYLRH